MTFLQSLTLSSCFGAHCSLPFNAAFFLQMVDDLSTLVVVHGLPLIHIKLHPQHLNKINPSKYKKHTDYDGSNVFKSELFHSVCGKGLESRIHTYMYILSLKIKCIQLHM